MLEIVIGDKRKSSWSLRPWLALRHTGAPFTETVVRLDRPTTKAEILARSPSGRVPALRDGDVLVWESLAICEHLAERFPEAHLWPVDPAARAHARAISCEMHAGFADVRREMPMDLCRAPEPVALSGAARAQVARILSIWTETRARFGAGGPLLFGAFTVADAMYAPVATRFRSYGVPVDGDARAYADALLALAAMTEWYAAAALED
jgi:glutathione S-transferase